MVGAERGWNADRPPRFPRNRRCAFQAPEAACRSSTSYVAVAVRRSWHSRIWPTPASSRRKAGEGAGDAGIVERKGHFIDMFPVWDTLSANKTGRCPKWPRPK